MTYKEYIQNIINIRGQWNIPQGEYYEKHHILPRCMGGEGDYKNKSFKKYSNHLNCIYLYPEEHFIAHKLLALENLDNLKIIKTFMSMKMLHNEIEIDDIEYGIIKRNYANHLSTLYKKEGNPHYDVHTNYGSSGMTGKHHNEKVRQDVSKRFKGISQSKEFIERRVCKLRHRIQNLETGKVYKSKKEAKLEYGNGFCGSVIDTYHTTKGCHYISIEKDSDILNYEQRKLLIDKLELEKHINMSNGSKKGFVNRKELSYEIKEKLKIYGIQKHNNNIEQLLKLHNINIEEYKKLREDNINNCPNKVVQEYYNLTYSQVRKLNEHFKLSKGGSCSYRKVNK